MYLGINIDGTFIKYKIVNNNNEIIRNGRNILC